MSALVLGGTPTIFAAGVETRHARRRNSSLQGAVHAAVPRRAVQMRRFDHRPSGSLDRADRGRVQLHRRLARLDRDHNQLDRRARARHRLDLSHSAGDLADGRPLSRRHRRAGRAHPLPLRPARQGDADPCRHRRGLAILRRRAGGERHRPAAAARAWREPDRLLCRQRLSVGPGIFRDGGHAASAGRRGAPPAQSATWATCRCAG